MLHFTFITCCVDEEFFDPVKKGVRDAAEQLGVSTSFIGTADVDVDVQIGMVKQAIQDGCDGIALSIIHASAFDGVVQAALDKGIPVVAFNVDANPGNGRLSAVCQDLRKAGRGLGARAAQIIPDKARVLLTVHSEHISALEDRLAGISEALSCRNVDAQIIATGMVPEQAADIIEKALANAPDIAAILGTGLADTEGAGLAAERCADGDHLFVGGFDISPNILRLIHDGVIDMTIDQQPYMQGFYPVLQLAHYCRYRIMPSNIDAGAFLVTSDNVKTIMQLCSKGYR